MQFSFDLISDLHLDSWPEFDWSGLATSPVCVVAGDVARDRNLLIKTLKHLSKCYQAVFYIDGNEEHRNTVDDLNLSYNVLNKQLSKLQNVVFLQDNVVVIDGVAILGTNGWWAFDFDPDYDTDESIEYVKSNLQVDDSTIDMMGKLAITDSAYMYNSVKRLQTHRDVKKIVMVSHTVPDPALIQHDIDLENNPRRNTMGNRYMMRALAADTENKIDTWCFGHYHGSVDQVRSGVRFVNNCRGRANTLYSQYVYHPKRIVIDL